MTSFSFSRPPARCPRNKPAREEKPSFEHERSSYPCGVCGGKTGVIDSRSSPEGIRRRRKCVSCGERITTMERVYTPGMGSNPKVSAAMETARRLIAQLQGLPYFGDWDE